MKTQGGAMPTHFCLQISGDFACFTRPEMKVEPEKIEVLAPIRWTTLRRNEVGSKVSLANVKSAMQNGFGSIALYVEEERQQRASLLLRDVLYRITASFKLTGRAGAEESAQKFAEMFSRRAGKGQCINQPYLGCREFACDFRLVEPGDEPVPMPAELRGERDLGWMLYDLDFRDPASPQPRFFHALMTDGVVIIPRGDSGKVRG
jgi:CRISPR-associated protein Cas5d